MFVLQVVVVLTSIVIGEGQPWFGKSSWGHPDFDRKSVRPVVVHACIMIAAANT